MSQQRSIAPLKKLSAAAGQCSAQAERYGQCMLQHYREIERDVCATEFRAFLACVRKHVR